jgi:hypothetical protein
MSSQAAMSLLCFVEFALWSALGFFFWKRALYRRFPAMARYLALRVASTPVLIFFLYGQARHWFNGYFSYMYFYGYWVVYLASAVLIFFICVEVFRSALFSFPGLMKLGTVAFRWVALASVIVGLSTLVFEPAQACLITNIAYRLMRSVSILELCLLVFLCLSMNALRLPMRDMAFGIALGFGLMSTNDFVNASILSRNSSLTDTFQFVSESLILVSLGIWTAYAALPEPAQRTVMVPANSTILRWNEIASALGHTGTQVAVQQPDSGFFLTDVEKAIEKALSRNSE